ncbi:hypothetical protein [Streptomyces sp. NBC_00872]|uniref:hypothetical protein n=1 Tax=Streptomyces sp. NBC_00872 TaxID=2903686 RepID=UPI00386BAC2A|nr:hypothetical protein OG214_09230 [Streptomyces sp. NBC_00872]
MRLTGRAAPSTGPGGTAVVVPGTYGTAGTFGTDGAFGTSGTFPRLATRATHATRGPDVPSGTRGTP